MTRHPQFIDHLTPGLETHPALRYLVRPVGAARWYLLKQTGKPRKLCQVKWCRKKPQHWKTFCGHCAQTLWRINNPLKAAFAQLRSSARRDKRFFDLTLEEFEYICRTTGYLTRVGIHANELHLDRIDPTKGYTVSNLQVLTCADNSRKGSIEDRKALYVHNKIHANA